MVLHLTILEHMRLKSLQMVNLLDLPKFLLFQNHKIKKVCNTYETSLYKWQGSL